MFGYDVHKCEFIELVYSDNLFDGTSRYKEYDRRMAIELNIFLFGYKNFQFILGVNGFFVDKNKYKVISLFHKAQNYLTLFIYSALYLVS